jgi:DNA polymerase/3'-5' exonuclease PolX
MEGYIQTYLSSGPKKCMAICRVSEKYRRIDLMLTEPSAYSFALLYFTGSKEFNVLMRNRAIEKGMKLNEYGLYKKGILIDLFEVHRSEKFIMEYLEMEYVDACDR